MNATARLQFLTWLKDTHPGLYSEAIRRARSGALGADEDTGGFWSNILKGITAAGTTYLSLKNQRDAMKLNLQRAEQGLPPVDAGVTAPVIRTQIDLPPDVVERVTKEAGTSVNKMLLLGAAAIAALLIIKK